MNESTPAQGGKMAYKLELPALAGSGESIYIRKSKATETCNLCARHEEGRVGKTRVKAVLPATDPHGDNKKNRQAHGQEGWGCGSV